MSNNITKKVQNAYENFDEIEIDYHGYTKDNCAFMASDAYKEYINYCETEPKNDPELSEQDFEDYITQEIFTSMLDHMDAELMDLVQNDSTTRSYMDDYLKLHRKKYKVPFTTDCGSWYHQVARGA